MERKHNVEYYHYSYVFMCKDKLICCGGFFSPPIFIINVDLHPLKRTHRVCFWAPDGDPAPDVSERRLLTQPSSQHFCCVTCHMMPM